MKKEKKNSSFTAIAPENPALEKKAFNLAKEFNLPVVSPEATDYSYLLIVTSDRVVLKNKHLKNSKVMSVDFLSPKLRYRQSNHQREWLKKALGTLPPSSLIVDATAGFGEDAFILASQGYRVIMLERSAVLAALLTDGLARFYRSVTTAVLPISLELVHQDAKIYLPELAKKESIDVVYLDPMFPERKKSALSRKEMEALRIIVGADPDVDELFKISLAVAKNRVIVKRPGRSEPLGNINPTFSIEGKLGRLDVYSIY